MITNVKSEDYQESYPDPEERYITTCLRCRVTVLNFVILQYRDHNICLCKKCVEEIKTFLGDD